MKRTILAHIAELATPKGREARQGARMNELSVTRDAAVVIEGENILAVGDTDTILSSYRDGAEIRDLSGHAVVPGFVDSHTHFLFGGYRPEEFMMRLAGESYLAIHKAGGGIECTVEKTRNETEEQMDREGFFMYRALEICRNLADFETYLDTLTRPMGVEANFGVIDAEGGAAYYETNNHKWVKFDVNAMPDGYRVVTNFTETGREQDRKGVDRYQISCAVFAALSQEELSSADHRFLFNKICRSGKPILRNASSSSVVFEGVRAGGDPLQTVMWALVGWAETAVYVPLMVMDSDHMPFYVKADPATSRSVMCDNGLKMKPQNLSEICRKTEEFVDTQFDMLYRGWVDGSLSSPYFLRGYGILMDNYYNVYSNNFAPYL